MHASTRSTTLFLALFLGFTTLACADGGDDDGDPMGGVTLDIPSEAAKLFPYLQEGGYKGFPSETAVHQSTGPHGMVKVFLSGSLDGSLGAPDGEHPQGAAAVKELYSSDGRDLIGWSAMVKTDDSSDGGKGWFWYEILSTTSDASPIASGNGVGLCTGCHGGAGNVDFVLTPYPLR